MTIEPQIEQQIQQNKQTRSDRQKLVRRVLREHGLQAYGQIASNNRWSDAKIKSELGVDMP